MQTEITQPRSIAQRRRAPRPGRLVASAAAGLQPGSGALLPPATPAVPAPEALGLLRRLHPAALLLRHHRRPGLRRQHLRLYPGFRQRRAARRGAGRAARRRASTCRATARRANPATPAKGSRCASESTPGQRQVFVDWPAFHDGRGIHADLRLHCPPEHELMTIVIPIGEKRFYYNRKINCMPASGYLRYGGIQEELLPSESLASLDWGRGVWEYRSFWNWASASGFLADGRRIGLNLGCGFGDLSAATENCLVLEGRVHKLDQVRFEYDPADYSQPWKFSDNEGRLSLDLYPLQRPHSADEPGHHLQPGAPDVRALQRLRHRRRRRAHRDRRSDRLCRRAPGALVSLGSRSLLPKKWVDCGAAINPFFRIS